MDSWSYNGYRHHPDYNYDEYSHNGRRYGAQYEPGGYDRFIQQRSNMTQREDALKFEQGRIKALQEERLHIQKKTFTKWMNSFLQKARMEVNDLFEDLADGRRLLKLLEIISGEKLAKPNDGRMRVHKIENVNKSLAFLHTKVRLESIGAEDIVDGNPRLILGLIWTIILRFQIQEIEIDVDEENESSEKKSAKDALLLWCQRKTNGYHGVHIHNFTDSWRSGLGFNALIHAHRPDLFLWSELTKKNNIDNLNHAFDLAHNHLGIPKLLDAEDVDTSRPDEKSVMTYVASYYHTFARMKNEQKSGRRIANIIGQLMDCDARKAEYNRLFTALLEWIHRKIEELNNGELPNSLDGVQKMLLAFKEYRTIEKPPKYKERSEIEALFFHINTMQKSLVGEPWTPNDGQLPQDLERAWQKLEQSEHSRELALRNELLRQQRLEQLNYKFNTKSVLRKTYLKEMIHVLSDPRYGSNLSQVDATVKKHEAISADILARSERFEDLTAMANELIKENYHGADGVSKTEQQVLSKWHELLELLNKHRDSLAKLSQLMALVREADTALATVDQLRAEFQSEEVGPHLVAVEQLAQSHALKELQLGALDESIRRLVRQGKQVQGPVQAKQQLENKLKQLEDSYDSLLASAKDRKSRLDEARNLYQFLEDHDEEEGWVTDKQRICRTGLAAKDLRAVLALQQKHNALIQEIRAREPLIQRHVSKGKSLIDTKHPKSSEIEKKLQSLNSQWELLRELAEAREKQLQDACAAYQFYADGHEAESWLREHRAVLSGGDVGRDANAASARLARHKAAHSDLVAYKHEIKALTEQGDRLIATGIHRLQLPTEVESVEPLEEEEEWVKETRLVPTEVWEEEPVERLEHRTVTEERSVPQVKALYAFSGQGITIQKGDIMFLINKTNPDWWSVRKADRTDGFVPANYVREIEPRIIPVQVRRPEKVRSVQRVKKTVLVKQVVPVKRPRTLTRRNSRNAQMNQSQQPMDTETVDVKCRNIQNSYDELLKLSETRREQLEDAIKLYEFFAECEDFEKWIKDKEKLLRSDDSSEGVEAAKRKYEKFVTDMSASMKRLSRLEAQSKELIATKHPHCQEAAARAAQLRQAWDRLVRLKAQKEKSLEGASSVELFGRTCDEAYDWMLEKSSQLEAAHPVASDLRTVRALQRRHAQLERELEPLKEKVNTVNMLADSVKSQYPSEQKNVETRQREIQVMWEQCQVTAAERRARLENAVGHQIFTNGSESLIHWTQKIREQLAAETNAKDVSTAESLIKEHNDIKDDIKAHHDEFDEVIALGDKLVKNNPQLSDVAEKVAQLKKEKNSLEKEWYIKESYLKQLHQLQTFNREADQIDASSGAHEAFLEYREQARSVDEAEALVKRHEEFEACLLAQDERLRAFCNNADTLIVIPHYAAKQIKTRKDQVVNRRDAIRKAAATRRRSLQGALAFQQFLAAADDLETWIGDKMRTATDQNYRDLTNLERKLQKHEAYERELNANERQIRNVDSVGQSLIASDETRVEEVSGKLKKLHKAWETLVAASRDKGSKLRQAAAQRAHKRSAEDAMTRLVDLDRALHSKETGADLRSCKRLLNQHQALEQELTQWESKATELAASGSDMVAAGHFDADTVKKESKTVLNAASALREPAKKRRDKLEEGLRFHKFAAEISAEQQWIAERVPAASSEAAANDLHGAQHAHKKHNKLREEITGHKAVIDKLLKQGDELVSSGHPDSDKIVVLSKMLKKAYKELVGAAETRAARLEASLKSQQFMHDALEVDSWLADKAAALSSTDYGRDRHQAMQLLTRHKAVELELDTYAAIVSEMGHTAKSMASSGHPDGAALLERQELLSSSLERLKRLAAQRQKALVESMCRHEYLTESAELEQWILEQYAAASSEDYGQDYEHLLLLRSKFEELRHRVENGSERFNQCEELANKLVASDSPYIPDIERRQEALGEAWKKLVEQVGSRSARLVAAGEIHRFHRDVADALARMADKRARLATVDSPRDYNAALAILRRHETLENDLIALDAQLQVLMEDAERLQQLYPGGNVVQIQKQQKLLSEGWESLKAAAAQRKELLLASCDLHRFLTQVRDLMSWCSGVRASLATGVRVNDTVARADHDALKAEIEAREDSFASALDLGNALVQSGHRNANEVEERCEALLSERSRLHAAWQARQVELDQMIDLHFFLRDAKQLHNLCAAQEAALSTDIPGSSSVEEVDNQLKKHQAFEKLMNTQDEKLIVLKTHGAKLLAQNHVESKRISEELEAINHRRMKVHELSAERKKCLRHALLRAQFNRDAAEARAWIAGKKKKLNADQQQGDAISLEDKIKKLQKHQAFRAELAANVDRMSELTETFKKLSATEKVEEERATLNKLQQEWKELLARTEEEARGLEEAQDILEFNQHLEKIEAWIRDKEMMVQAHDLGKDYEHCNAIIRKLDDLDSDMRVDDKHIKTICALADKLLQQGPSQQSKAVATRRDAFLTKWKALSGSLQDYRDHLTTALEIHSYNRDIADTMERVSEKATLMSSQETGRDLSGVEVLRRKHDALKTETSAIGDKIKQHKDLAEKLRTKYPERKEEIGAKLNELEQAWENLKKLADKRSKLLDEALTVHRFDEDLKQLELWVGENVKRMAGAETPNSVAEAQALLELHHEKKAEIDSRQKSVDDLELEAKKKLATLANSPIEVDVKVKKLKDLSKSIDQSWHDRKQYLNQAHQLQLLKEQARQTEDWLAAKEAVLNNDDLGENLAAVDMLIRKHAEFEKLLNSQLNRVDELEKMAEVMLAEGHYDAPYIKQRVNAISKRRDKLRESCANRGEMLQQSKQLHQFMRNLYHEREWISLKMQLASDQNYRDLSNLQSKMQKHAAFESELHANKGRIDKVVNDGELLIDSNHYAAEEIGKHVEDLEASWRDLQEAAKDRRDRLTAAYQARVYLRGLEDFNIWIDEVEAQLLSEDHGKDLASVNALLKRHGRLEQQVAGKSETAAQLEETAEQLAEQKHFMADEIVQKAESAVQRYKQLQEPMQIRRDNLEDSLVLQRWLRDAEEEEQWLKEREPAAKATDVGKTLSQAQLLQKKHLALEAELNAREPAITALCSRAQALVRRGHFAGQELESKSLELQDMLKTLLDLSSVRRLRLQDAVELHQFNLEAGEAENWLMERRPILASSDVGRDEDSVVALQRRLEVHQRELSTFDATLNRLEKLANGLQDRVSVDCTAVKKKLDSIKHLYEDLKLLSAKRQQRLQQSLKYFRFVHECEEVQEWINDQMIAAASEDYGSDVEHVETLQHAFDLFLTSINANEGRIESITEAGAVLIEENTPEKDLVQQRVTETKGLWEDLKELALARQEALAGARQVHMLDRAADEAVAWIAEKHSALTTDLAHGHDLHSIQGLVKKHEALEADLEAIKLQVSQLTTEAENLSHQYPDAQDHVSAKLEEVTEAFSILQDKANSSREQLQRAELLQAYFDNYQELVAWTNEALARVTAPELARDVPGAEQLVARHKDLRAEIDSRNDAFQSFYKDGEKLVKEGHFLSSEINDKMTSLRQRRQLLDDTWNKRNTIYIQHLDAVIFKRDADLLDSWITSRVPQLREGKLGDSISHVEELIKRHDDFQKTIEAQGDKFNALKRITLVEQAFLAQLNQEAEDRRKSAERQEAERMEQARRREMQRIADQRRKEDPHAIQKDQKEAVPVQGNRDPDDRANHVFGEKLGTKTDVKRAESMNVGMKTPKRTPSFTTRRRTQSFRRHQLADPAELPPVEIKGELERKQNAGVGGKRAPVRSWRSYYTVLCGQLLCFFRDEIDLAHSKAAAPPVVILNAKCKQAGDYTKRKHVFRLSCADGAEYLFAAGTRELMDDWITKISFHASLTPDKQLTPYQRSDDTALVRRKLQENASTSSSENSSPEPKVRHRTQAEILHEHRASLMREQSSPTKSVGKDMESSVLPSLPPRQPITEEDFILQNSNKNDNSWGNTRFSNGRDINTEFIRSQQAAVRRDGHVTGIVNSYQSRQYQRQQQEQRRGRSPAPPATAPSWEHRQNNNWVAESSYHYGEIAVSLPSAPASNTSNSNPPSRPTSATDRHHSESSGESELSVTSSKDKKKGVFGGLFSRKKRPHSQIN